MPARFHQRRLELEVEQYADHQELIFNLRIHNKLTSAGTIFQDQIRRALSLIPNLFRANDPTKRSGAILKFDDPQAIWLEVSPRQK